MVGVDMIDDLVVVLMLFEGMNVDMFENFWV